MIPSGEEAAIVLGPLATVAKIPFPNVTEFQVFEVGKVLGVQLIPSVEVAAIVVGPTPPAIATKTLFPNVTEIQLEELGIVLAVHEDASDVTAMPIVVVVFPAELFAVIV